MNTLTSMLLATLLFVASQLIIAHPEQDVPADWTYEESSEECVVVNNYAYCEGSTGYDEAVQLIEDCIGDYVLDWESDSCAFLHPEDYS